MYAYIKGTLEETGEDYIVVEAGGIGYQIFTTGQTFQYLPSMGEEVKVYTYLHVREDAMILFGFLTKDDLFVFRLLLGVSGIGPKGALAILSVMTTDDLRFAVLGDDAKAIAKAPGVGAKTAQRLILELKDKICMDVGASTGGFTDCMLQNGATKVYSVDVGHGQLAWKLRNDERVVCMEKTNIRYVTHENIPDEIGFSSIDVSFISLTKVLGPVKALLKDDGQVVCLIKPQFEAGREKVGKKGVVRDKAVHLEVIEMVIAFAKSIGFEILNLEFSPIKGPEGNIEYLLHLQNHPEGEDGPVIYEEMPVDPKKIVEEAHAALDKE